MSIKNTDDILIELLKNIFDDKDFIGFVTSCFKTEDEKKQMIEFIKNNKNISSEEITLIVLSIRQERKKGDTNAE